MTTSQSPVHNSGFVMICRQCTTHVFTRQLCRTPSRTIHSFDTPVGRGLSQPTPLTLVLVSCIHNRTQNSESSAERVKRNLRRKIFSCVSFQTTHDFVALPRFTCPSTQIAFTGATLAATCLTARQKQIPAR